MGAYQDGRKAFNSYLSNVEALTAQLDLTDPDCRLESDYLTLIEQQSQLISKLRHLASLVGSGRNSGLRFEEDEGGNIIGGSECQCLPKVPEGEEVSLTLVNKNATL